MRDTRGHHRLPWGFAPALLFAMLAVALPARADSVAQRRAAADALYADAGRLMDQGRFAEACPKLERSQRLDPGIGTLLRLGYCYLGTGRTASAWASFRDAESTARAAHDWRAAAAAEQVKTLAPNLSKLAICVDPENRAAGVELRRDGDVVAPSLWGVAVPVDPGEYVVEATKTGRLGWTSKVVIAPRPGITTVVNVPALALDPPTVRTGWTWTPRKKAAIGVLIGAGASVTAGTVLLAARPDAKATTLGTGVTLGLGGAALVTGMALFFGAPREEPDAQHTLRVQVSPALAASGSGMLMRGEW
jgi:hypothetical protein